MEPPSLLELILLILYLGSLTFLVGAFVQGYILYQRKISLLKAVVIVLLTRIISIVLATVIWATWAMPIDVMWLFLFLPALLPEIVFSPLMLKIFGVFDQTGG